MDFKITRTTGDEELAVIRDLAVEIWPEVFSSIVPSGQVEFMLDTGYSLEALRKADAGGEMFYLARLDGSIVGYLAMTDFGDGHGKLNKIYLRGAARGLGLGRQMLEFAADWGRKRKLNHLVLNVNLNNRRALRVYRAAGWSHFRDETIDIGQGFVCDDHILKLDL